MFTLVVCVQIPSLDVMNTLEQVFTAKQENVYTCLTLVDVQYLVSLQSSQTSPEIDMYVISRHMSVVFKKHNH